MLRIFSSKIFREDLSNYALPMCAFEKFDDAKNKINMNNNTYKFCLPVSIGDFPETNVPACFSNSEEELRKFVETQTKLNHRKAFIMSDFQVTDLSKICFSGVINTNSQRGLYDHYNKSTTINITFKNPILTYAQEGISPRDLPADIQLTYDHVSSPSHAFPKINIINKNIDLKKCKDIIYQAYMASAKIHKVAEQYDGQEYSEHALFFVDDKNRVQLYEIIGEEAFLGKADYDENMIREELKLVTLLPDDKSEKLPSWDLKNWTPEQLKKYANLSKATIDPKTEAQEDFLSK
ncbi:MAG: hypothetical protein V8R82_05125 [Clostridia bacterium]